MLTQLIANGVLAGSIYAVVAVGFALIYRVVRFFHFTHGLIFTLGAYQAYELQACCEFTLPWSALTSLAVAALAGLLLNATIFTPLKNRRAAALVAMLASLGLYVIGQNIIAIFFGDQTLSIQGAVVVTGLDIGGARLTPAQIVIVATSWLAVVGTISFLRFTRFGEQIRAISNDPTLALIVGIPTTRIVAISVAVGSALAGLGGFLAAVDHNMVPNMGMAALLIAVMAMIMGGTRSLFLVAISAMLISMLQNISVLWLPAAWQESIAFGVLLLFLLLKPAPVAIEAHHA
jgi:branched-chain amino acid transport system permease protein